MEKVEKMVFKFKASVMKYLWLESFSTRILAKKLF